MERPLTDRETAELRRLLADLPVASRWQVEHIHRPTLAVLDLTDSADALYVSAARRRALADPAQARGRALSLLEYLRSVHTCR